MDGADGTQRVELREEQQRTERSKDTHDQVHGHNCVEIGTVRRRDVTRCRVRTDHVSACDAEYDPADHEQDMADAFRQLLCSAREYRQRG